jgi:hypothetical protein
MARLGSERRDSLTGVSVGERTGGAAGTNDSLWETSGNIQVFCAEKY